MPKTKHLIKNYDQVLLRLTDLVGKHVKQDREFYFAVGDLFNQEIPAGVASPEYAGHMYGMRAADFSKHISHEIDDLLEKSGANQFIGRARLIGIKSTCRAWLKDERTFDVAFSVYEALRSHKELMRDGMTATEAAALRKLHKGASTPEPTKIPQHVNRVQWLNVTKNQLRGQLNALADAIDATDSEPFTPEEAEIVSKMYDVLNSFVKQTNIEYIWDLEAAA